MSTSTTLEPSTEHARQSSRLEPARPSPEPARQGRTYKDPFMLSPDEQNEIMHDYFDNALDILVVASNAKLRLFDLIDWLESPPIAARLARLRQAALERVERVAAHRAVAAMHIIADLAWTRADSDRAIETKRKAAALVIRTAKGQHPAKRTRPSQSQPQSPAHPDTSGSPQGAVPASQPAPQSQSMFHVGAASDPDSRSAHTINSSCHAHQLATASGNARTLSSPRARKPADAEATVSVPMHTKYPNGSAATTPGAEQSQRAKSDHRSRCRDPERESDVAGVRRGSVSADVSDRCQLIPIPRHEHDLP